MEDTPPPERPDKSSKPALILKANDIEKIREASAHPLRGFAASLPRIDFQNDVITPTEVLRSAIRESLRAIMDESNKGETLRGPQSSPLKADNPVATSLSARERKKAETRAQHEEWKSLAREMKAGNPNLSNSAIAKNISRRLYKHTERAETIRKIIRDH